MGINCFVNFDIDDSNKHGNNLINKEFGHGRIDAVIYDIAQNGGDKTFIEKFISDSNKTYREQWIDFIIFVYKSYMKYQPESINNISPITYIDDSQSMDLICSHVEGMKIPFNLMDKTDVILGIFNDSKFRIDRMFKYTHFFYGSPPICVVADMFEFKNELKSELICRLYSERTRKYVYSDLLKMSIDGPIERETAHILRNMVRYSQQNKYCYENNILSKWPDFPYKASGGVAKNLSSKFRKYLRSILSRAFLREVAGCFHIELIHDDVRMCNFCLKGKMKDKHDEYVIPLDFDSTERLLNFLTVSDCDDNIYESDDISIDI